MAVIVFLIGLFLFFCLLHGIYSSVGAVVQGTSRTKPTPSRQPVAAPPTQPSTSAPLQQQIDELKALFELHQSGALTQEEFEQMKRHLLSTSQLSQRHIDKDPA